MEAFDAGRTGTLNFYEFLRMITTNPWAKMLPEEVQRHLPGFVYQDAAAGSSYKPKGADSPQRALGSAIAAQAAARAGGGASAPASSPVRAVGRSPAARSPGCTVHT